MVQDLILIQNVFLQMDAWEKKELFSELIWAHICTSIKIINISQEFMKVEITTN